ncbi:hypothetical protein MAPG_00732 [Magnaporthiopsis poae ATCC 64411]|uniref:Uncharacterized protein n=1 Tax=Magnaporthiopsis poae (strain ATCC 64411 / 73-15) TaxID=644358 RepID=A0A0C4DLT6_MAGP6|nr:hypothetical protein MAPG_00732 [Magnaporthiopsis poae ATCC 64411]
MIRRCPCQTLAGSGRYVQQGTANRPGQRSGGYATRPLNRNEVGVPLSPQDWALLQLDDHHYSVPYACKNPSTDNDVLRCGPEFDAITARAALAPPLSGRLLLHTD